MESFVSFSGYTPKEVVLISSFTPTVIAALATATVANMFFFCALSQKDKRRDLLIVCGLISTLLGATFLFRETISERYDVLIVTILLTVPLIILLAMRLLRTEASRRKIVSRQEQYAPAGE